MEADLPYIQGNVRVIFYATQADCTGKTQTGQPHLGGKIQNRAKIKLRFKGVKHNKNEKFCLRDEYY